MKYHKELNDKWQSLSLMEQMANIGSEVSRTINWKGKSEKDAQISFRRGLELFDLTIDDHKNVKRLKEIVRARELFTDWYFGCKKYKTSDKEWRDYFLNFAIAARLNR